MKSARVERSEVMDHALSALHEISASGRPVVVGPWLGEIGFELLYWIPFLRWARTQVDLPADRLTVLSRGGCDAWYTGITSNYRDLYAYYTPREVCALNTLRVLEQGEQAPQVGLRHGLNSRKQYVLTPTERAMLAHVAPDAAVLHPGVMYRLFRLFWRARLADLHARCTRVARLSPPPVPSSLAIPDQYVAVKFYTSEACRDREGHRQAVARIVSKIAVTVPVVLLDSGRQYDEHGNFDIDDPRLIRPELEPRTNLATQTAIIARAQAFVGTYGGFAYLAPLLGVATTAFYGERTFREDHYQVAIRVCAKLRTPFTVLSLEDGLKTMGRQWRRWAHAA